MRASPGVRQLAVALLIVALVLIAAPPQPALAAAGTVTTTASGARIYIGLLGGLLPISINLPEQQVSWTSGGPPSAQSTLSLDVPGILTVGATTTSARPAGGGGRAEAHTAGLTLLGTTLGLDAITATCEMTGTAITTDVDVANLTLLGQTINPGIGLSLGVPGVLTATLDKRTATYDPATGRLDYTVRGLDLDLLGGLSIVASGSVVLAEATCSGIVRLGAVTTAPAAVVPGTSGTPTVTIANPGDIAAPNTVVRIPAPPAGWTLGTPTVTGGGTCTRSSTYVTCTGVTVPGGGSATVALPVALAPGAAGASAWAPDPGSITATSTPIAEVTGTRLTTAGAGTLATALPPVSTGGSLTPAPVNLAAGKSTTTTVTVANQGPSDATTDVRIPIGNRPAGVSVASAAVDGIPCTVTTTDITCTNVTVPGAGSIAVSIRATATTTTLPGTVWDLAGLGATLNGTAITGQGRLLTVSDPDVNLDRGVSLGPATAVPGGVTATATVRARNLGIIPATATTITVAAPPGGYTVGPVTTSGGGSCTTTDGIRCTGVTVPAMGAVTVTVPVTLAPDVTAPWAPEVTATSGDSTGTVTGTLITPDPQVTLAATATGPAARTIRPGQTAPVTADVRNQGPSDTHGQPFVVVAPASTTIGALPPACESLSPTTARCTLDLAAGATRSLSFAFAVSAEADPTDPLTGGCLSLDDNATCGDPADRALPAIALRTPLADRLTVTTTPATITPGTEGVAVLRLTSSQPEPGLTVTVPTAQLPAGFTVTTATCTGNPTTITCTDVAPGDVPLRVRVGAGVVPPASWTATGITVSDGSEQVTLDGLLATAGSPRTGLGATVSGPEDNTIEPGETTELRIVVANAGPSDAPAAAFTVGAPAGTSFGGPLPAGCTAASSTRLSCTVALAAGASTPGLTVPLTVAATTPPFDPLVGGCVDFDPAGGCDVPIGPIYLKVPFARQVAVTTTAATVTPGATGTATVAVRATHGDLDDLTVVVPLGALPPGLTVTSPDCPVAGSEIRCTGFTVGAGETGTVRLTVAATAATAPGTTWTATGVSVAGADGSVGSDPELARTGPAVVTLTATATLPAGRLEPGDRGTLTVAVTNRGPSDAAAARFGVLLPPGATWEPGPCPATGDRAGCPISAAAGATDTVTLPFRVDAGATGSQLTGGCVDLDDDGFCAVPPDEELPAIYLATPLSGRLTVTTTPASVVPGTTGTARLTLTSTQPETGLAVTIPLGDLPAGFTSPGCAPAVCTGVDLDPGEPVTIDIPVTVDPGGRPPASWTASGVTVTDPATGGTVTVGGLLASAAAPRSVLAAMVTGPAAGTVGAGDTTEFTVVATNTGPSDATGVPFAVRAPAGTAFGTLTGTAANLCTAAFPTVLSCTATLAVGDPTPALSIPLTVDATVDPFVPLTGGCVDLDGTPGCGPGDEEIGAIQLSVPFARRAEVTTTSAAVTPGTSGTATVVVTATRDDLTDLTVVVPLAALPPGLTVTGVTANATCAITASDVRCTGLDVTAGESEPVTLRVLAAAAAAPGLVWRAAGITVQGALGQVTTAGELARTTAAVADLDTVATMPDPVEPGATGTLSLAVTNRGPSDATGAELSVVAPAGTTFGTPLPDGCIPFSTTWVTCRADLAAGGSLRLGLPLRVDAAAAPGTTLTGGCLDLDGDGRCTTPPDEALPGLTVATPFDRQVTLTTVPATVTPGAGGTASVVVTSDRPQSGLTLTVPLTGVPAGVTVGTPAGCTRTATAITCTGLGAGAIEVPVALTTAATDATWTARDIILTTASGATATGTGVLVRAGAPRFTLTAAATAPAADTILPGTVGVYSAVLRNTGPSAAAAAPVTVRAPFGTTFGPLTAATGQLCARSSDTALTCTVTLGAGASVPLALPVAVPGSAAAAEALTGGCVDLDGDAACGGDADAALPDLILRFPLTQVLTATGTPADIPPGGAGTVAGTITAREARDDVFLRANTASLPAGLTVDRVRFDGVTCPVAGSVITCPLTDLPAGVAVPWTFELSAAADTSTGSVWAPVLTLGQGTEVYVARTVLATVGAAAHPTTVTFKVPASGTLLPGGTGQLQVDVTNEGPSVFQDARSYFVAPAGTSFTGLSGPTAAACTLISPALAACERDIAVGTTTYTVGLAVPPTATPGQLIRGGCLDTDLDGACTVPPDQRIPAFRLGIPFSGQARLGTEPATVTPGTSGTAAVTLTADRPLTALTATIPLAGLPAGFTADPGDGCARTDAEIVCTGLAAVPGEQRLVGLTVGVPAGAAEGVTWAPAITLTDVGGSTSRVTAALAVAGAPRIGITYTITPPPDPTVPGTTVTMTVTVANAGPSDAAGVTTGLIAPAGTTFGAPLPAGCLSAAADRLTCRFDLAAGAPPLIWALPVVVPPGADPDTGLSGGCVDRDGDGTCGPGDVALPGIPLTPALVLSVAVPDPGTVRPGGTGLITVTVVNRGDTDIRGLSASVLAPAGTTLLSVPGPCTLATPVRADCTLTVPAGGRADHAIRIQVPGTADPATPLTGGCVDVGRDGSCGGRGDRPVPPIELGEPLSAEVRFTAVRGTVTPGSYGTSVLQVRARRALPGAAVSVPLAGLPAGLTVTGASGPAGSTCALGSTAITCTGLALEAGIDTVLGLVLTAASGLPAGVTWTAAGITLAYEGETATATRTLAVTGTPQSAVTYTVTAPTGTLAPGDLTTMTVAATNAGPSDATRVRLTVAAPSRTTFGTLSGRAAADCTATSDTSLTCTVDVPADATTQQWALPLLVASTATEGQTIAGACVTAESTRQCGGAATVSGEFALPGLGDTVTLTADPVVVTAGSTGTAQVSVAAESDVDGLTLVVPLTSLPAGVTVTGASLDGADCTIGDTAVTCTGVTLTVGTTAVLDLGVAVAATVAAGTAWQATGITLDQLVFAATLVTTTVADQTVTVTAGTPTVRGPAPGQTTVVPIRIANPGPADLNPFTLSVVPPTGTAPGAALPGGCGTGAGGSTVVCPVSLAAGESATVRVPLTVARGAAVGSTLGGGCVDEGLAFLPATFDGACGGPADVALPALTVAAPEVDLTIDHADPTPSAAPGGTVLLRLPYSNNGTTNAAGVRFLIGLPPGVTVRRASILADASGTATVDIACVAEPSPMVECTGPEAPVGAASELWLHLAVAQSAPAGTRPVTVTISTAGAEGNVIDNVATARLTIAGTPDAVDPGTPGLAATGRNVAGLVVLATLLVAAGAIARFAARRDGPR
ncbi:hypothetical protein [Actinoplanes sp. RD1]|uniref:hypothetical protein n=1 Tax=Actinoplanes sp. RD1 TaxID=3064538 RepID=UPI0027420E19|nr:hypothetical protein [Actinoplanes sp. RD1]